MIFRSSTESLARLSAFRVAGTGPMPMIVGSQPATAVARMRASTFRPWALANSSLTTSTAEAPSVSGDEVPAVTDPSAVEGGLQGRQLLGGGFRADAAVLRHPPPVGRFDGDDLVGELAGGLRRGGLRWEPTA